MQPRCWRIQCFLLAIRLIPLDAQNITNEGNESHPTGCPNVATYAEKPSEVDSLLNVTTNVGINMTTNVGINITTNVGIYMTMNVDITMTTNVGINMTTNVGSSFLNILFSNIILWTLI